VAPGVEWKFLGPGWGGRVGEFGRCFRFDVEGGRGGMGSRRGTFDDREGGWDRMDGI